MSEYLQLLILIIFFARINIVLFIERDSIFRRLRRYDISTLIGGQLQNVLAACHLTNLFLQLAIWSVRLRAHNLTLAQSSQRLILATLAKVTCIMAIYRALSAFSGI